MVEKMKQMARVGVSYEIEYDKRLVKIVEEMKDIFSTRSLDRITLVKKALAIIQEGDKFLSIDEETINFRCAHNSPLAFVIQFTVNVRQFDRTAEDRPIYITLNIKTVKPVKK